MYGRAFLVTEGKPQYEIFREENQIGQSELVVRFLGAILRRKVARDIDASEFKAPVAYIRMRENPELNMVDVVMTVRDPIKPKLFAKDGNLRLTYDIPKSYLGNQKDPDREKEEEQQETRICSSALNEDESRPPIACTRSTSAFRSASNVESLPLLLS